MWTIGPLGFVSPLLLLGLILLPILWLLLRAVPPAPVRRMFPGVALMLGLTDDETQTDRTPWWLLALRCLAIGAAIIGFAGPVLNPKTESAGSGPVLVLLPGGWGEAHDWTARMDRVSALLSEAAEAGRETAVVSLTDLPPDGALPFRSADAWAAQLPSFQPMPWLADGEGVRAWAETLSGSFDTFWMSDGLDHKWHADLLAALQARGTVTAFESARPVYGLKPARFDDGNIVVDALRNRTGLPTTITVEAHGLDPTGTPRQLATLDLTFAPADVEASGELSLPAELRNRVTRFEIAGVRSAGAVSLTDDSLRRREIAIVSSRDEREGLQLLSQTHYLEQALVPNADLIDGSISDIVLANPDVVILADVVTLAGSEGEALQEWVEGGGLLLRFAGPRLAASDFGRDEEDPLMPVRLRAGGRTVGGAMSWGEPKALRSFSAESPFFGLTLPGDVTVSSQVMAQPDPTLSERTIATLADGTPLVTRKRLQQGQVVLFHVTANADWSTLPLSGLFVQMLERLAVSTRLSSLSAEDLEGTTWTLDQTLNGYGEVLDAGTLPGFEGETLARQTPSADVPPGLYAGENRRIALNAVGIETALAAVAWPADVVVEGFTVREETPLKGILLSLALLALMADILATLALSGRLIKTAATAAGLEFRLRDGVYWHDGEPLDAEDVVFSLGVYQDKAHPAIAAGVVAFARVEVLDGNRVRYHVRPEHRYNRLLPIRIAELPVLSKRYWTQPGKDPSRPAATPPLGSGPYRIADYKFGRWILWERDPNYWARDLPVNRGRYNFDLVKYDSYRDEQMRTEALKGDLVDIHVENVPRRWATAYDFPPAHAGVFRRQVLPQSQPRSLWWPLLWNLDQARFRDIRVREALWLLNDFTWSNRRIGYGFYDVATSFFYKSPLAARGLPSARELALLEPLRHLVPPRVFTEAYAPPPNQGTGWHRDNLLRASELFREAGWVVENKRLVHERTGEPFFIRFVMFSPALARSVIPYTHVLKRLGIESSVKSPELSNWLYRMRSGDFDAGGNWFRPDNTPTLAVTRTFSTAAADQALSANFANIKNPAIDRLIEAMQSATTYPDYVAAARAVDRVLLWNFYYIPGMTKVKLGVAYWDRYGQPPATPLARTAFIDSWWWDADKARAVAEFTGRE